MPTRKKKADKANSRAFSCEYCQVSYTRKDNLIRHIKAKKHFLGDCDQESRILSKEQETSLPSFPYKVVENSANNFKITLPTISDEAGLQKFISAYSEKVGCQYIRRNKKKQRNSHLYYCEHHGRANAFKEKRESKTTGCSSSIFAVIDLCEPKHTTVRINFKHNHSMTSIQKIKFGTPTDDVRNRYIQLFNEGLTPMKAINAFREEIRSAITSHTEYIQYISDRKNYPDYYWVWSLHKKLYADKYESNDITAFITELNKEFNQTVVMYEKYDDQNFSIAICSPFMKRVVESNFAKELLFLDSTGSVDKNGLRVFLLLCKTNAGGAPIGVVITTSETILSISRGLNLLLKLYNENSFGGLNYPQVVITDDSASEIGALRVVFPESIHILCTFHVEQAWLRYLKKTPAEKAIFVELRAMLQSQDEDDLETRWKQISQKCESNAQLLKYLQDWYKKKEKWALCYRKTLPIRGSNTNNIVERSVRVLKENVLKRIKAQCPAELVSYLLNEYSQHYVNRFLDHVAEKNIKKPKKLPASVIDGYEFTQSPKNYALFTVTNKNTNKSYKIDCQAGICSCYVGVNGSYCKHQRILELSSDFQHPYQTKSTEKKQQLYYLAVGEESLPKNLLEPLTQDTTAANKTTTKHPAAYVVEEVECSIGNVLNDSGSLEFEYDGNESGEEVNFEESNNENDADLNCIVEEIVCSIGSGSDDSDFENTINGNSENVNIKESNLENYNTENAAQNSDEELAITESNDNLETFKSSLDNFYEQVSKDPFYYGKGIKAFTNDLRTALKTPSGTLDALYSLRRVIHRPRMRSTKVIAVNGPAHQRRASRKVKTKGSKLKTKGTRKTPHNIMYAFKKS